jgi:hypothetical protein
VLAIDHIVTTGTGRTAMRLSRRHEFTNWWHFDPSLTLVSEKSPGSWRVSGLPEGRTLFVSHVTAAEDMKSRLHLGELKPRTQGWISRSYLAYQPAPALGFTARAADSYFAATLFEIAEAGQEPGLSLAWRPTTRTVAVSFDPGSTAEFQLFRFGAFTLETGATLL